MFAELGQHLFGIGGASQSIEYCCRLARRKPDDRHVALAAAVVGVVITAETDNRSAPHLRLLVRCALHQLDQLHGICALRVIGNRLEERRDTQFGWFRLVLRHFSSSPFPSVYTSPRFERSSRNANRRRGTQTVPADRAR